MKDYLAMIKPKPGDKLDFGVKGMKWGIRRSKAELSAGKKTSSSSEAPSSGHSGSSSSGKSSSPVGEDSRVRYARLQAQAKAGKADNMSEPDLKFFNARTEALAKVKKMNESDPSWLSKTAKKVLQTTAERQLQAISDGVGNKYISGPILENLNKKK